MNEATLETLPKMLFCSNWQLAGANVAKPLIHRVIGHCTLDILAMYTTAMCNYCNYDGHHCEHYNGQCSIGVLLVKDFFCVPEPFVFGQHANKFGLGKLISITKH